MKHFIMIAWVLLILITLLVSGYLCYKGVDGWGWFLFAGILFAAGYSYTEKDEKGESE